MKLREPRAGVADFVVIGLQAIVETVGVDMLFTLQFLCNRALNFKITLLPFFIYLLSKLYQAPNLYKAPKLRAGDMYANEL